MEKYKILEKLGEGAFGQVYKAVNKKSNEIVAVKKLNEKFKSKDDCLELREVKSLQKLKHHNITRLIEVILEGEELYLVFQYLEVNLFEFYSKRKSNKSLLSEKQIKLFVYQIVEGLSHMHRSGFFHRDLKPENLLVTGQEIKLCDFGLVRQVRSLPPFTQYISTRWYRAPQLLLGAPNYNSPVDIFALGCIVAQLYNFQPLFPGSNQVDQLNKICQVLGTPDQQSWPDGYKLAQKKGYYFPSQNKKKNLTQIIPNASPDALNFIECALQFNPKKRIKTSQLIKHPYLQGLGKQSINNEQKVQVVAFLQNTVGKSIDTEQYDKKHQMMKLTKEKFFRSTKQLWNTDGSSQQSAIKKPESFKKQSKQFAVQQQDLESILKELQKQHQQRKAEKIKSMSINKQKIHSLITETKDYQNYKPVRYDDKFPSYSKSNNVSNIAQKDSPTLNIANRKLNYNFQPALIPLSLKPMPSTNQKTKQSSISIPLGNELRYDCFKDKTDGYSFSLKSKNDQLYQF